MKKILVIRFSALGDVAMLVPVLREYLAAHADDDTELTVLSRPFCAPLFEGLGPRVHFMGADLKGEYKGLGGLTRLFGKLHKMGFTEVCDEHSVLRTHYLTTLFRLFGYKVSRINKLRHERKLITAPQPEKQLIRCTTSFDKYRAALHLPTTAEEPGHTPTLDAATTRQSPSPAMENCRVGIAPFAAHTGKIYPAEQMQKVIALMVERCPKGKIYLFGGGGKEKEQMEQWQALWPDNVMVAGTVARGLKEELELMKTLYVMVSMDSANMHLASLVGLRVVSIWGATHPWAGFLGWGQSEDDCVQLNLPCRPCSIYGNKPCMHGDLRCMTGITPESVVERVFNS